MPNETDAVTERLAADLRTGVFPPGAWLKQVDLQHRYGVGRAPVRKALEVLAGRRLIRHELNRGFSVHPADTEEINQARALRLVLETGFAAAICDHATPDEIDEMQGLAARFDDFVHAGRLEPLYEVNLAFHRVVLGCARNPQLVALVDDLRLRAAPAATLAHRDLGYLMRRSAEHFDMVAAIRDGAPDELAGLMRTHTSAP